MRVSSTNRVINGLGPYHVESTGSRPITEVKQRRARGSSSESRSDVNIVIVVLDSESKHTNEECYMS